MLTKSSQRSVKSGYVDRFSTTRELNAYSFSTSLLLFQEAIIQKTTDPKINSNMVTIAGGDHGLFNLATDIEY